MIRVLALFLILLGCGRGQEEPPPRTERVVILHTNDIHGRVHPTRGRGGLSALSAMVKRIRREEAKKGTPVIVVDCGDFFQGTLDGDLPEGRLVVDIMNEIGYDALCLGNHEFDKGQGLVRRLARRAKFPFLGANILEKKTGRRPDYIKDSVTLHGVRLVGVISPDMPTLVGPEALEGLRIENPFDTLKRYPNSVVLSHCGDRIERRFPGEFVLGAHSHQRMTEERYQQAGCFALCLGYVALGPEPEAKVLRVEKGSDPAVDRIIAKYADEIDAVKNEVVGELAQDLPRSTGMQSSPLGNHLCDVMRDAADADIAFHNRTGIRANLSKGELRFSDVYEVSPFGNTIVAMDLTGGQILELLEYSVTEGTSRLLEVSGIEFDFDPRAPPGERILKSTVDPKKTYRVATNSFLADGGDGHEIFTKGANRRDTGKDLMRVHLEHLKANRPLKYEFRNRIRPKR